MNLEQQWLSDLPSDWIEKRADFFCQSHRINVDPSRYGDNLVAHYSIPKVQETGEFTIESAHDINSTKLLIKAPTLLVSKLNPRKRTICIANPHAMYPTLASSEFVAITPSSDRIDLRYAYYVWCSAKVTDRLSAIVQSTTRSHQRVNPADITKMPWRWPPIATQHRISKFLDEKTDQIDELIKKKRELLGRLAEKRRSLITCAVSTGLNPHAVLKPSGEEWLPYVPTHWQLKPLKYGTVKIGSGVTPRGGASVYVDSGVMFLRSQNIDNDGLILDDIAYIDDNIDSEMSETRVLCGDVLLNITGASIGRCCLFNFQGVRANVNQHVCIVRTSSSAFIPEFVELLLTSSVGKSQIDLSQNGASREGLNFGELGNFMFPYPPISEQIAISNTVSKRVKAVREQSMLVLKSIDSLKEYRMALVNAAVTGQAKGICQ